MMRNRWKSSILSSSLAPRVLLTKNKGKKEGVVIASTPLYRKTNF